MLHGADCKRFVLAAVLTRALGTTLDSWNSFNMELANKTLLIYEVVGTRRAMDIESCGDEQCMSAAGSPPACLPAAALPDRYSVGV